MSETYSIKAFAGCRELASNLPDTVAAVGEMSTYAQTFVRDRELFSTGVKNTLDANNPILSETTLECDVTVFSGKDVNGDVIATNDHMAYFLKLVSLWVYGTGGNGTFTDDAEHARSTFLSDVTNPDVTELTMGPMVQVATKYYPKAMSFKIDRDTLVAYLESVNDEDTAALDSLAYMDEVLVRLWFADDLFRAEFDEFEINHISPVSVGLDSFFQSSTNVRALLQARTVPMMIQRIDQIASGDPYTVVITNEFEYRDPNNSSVRIPTLWTAVIYGDAGRNPDLIKLSLIDWILANSTHTREEWAVIFPDIFKTTEFILTPMWNQYAVPNMTLQEGVYSPVMDLQDAMVVASSTASGEGYTLKQIVDSLVYVGTPYKSLAMVTVSGPENRPGAQTIRELWPDYMSVTTSSIDFDRMQQATQAWVTMLHTLLNVAENMTALSPIPQGFARIKRKNKDDQDVYFVAGTVNNVQYLVVAKFSLLSLFAAELPEFNPDVMPLSLLPADDLVLQTELGSKGLTVDFEAVGGVGPYTYTLASSPNFAAQAMGPSTGQMEITFNDFGQFVITVGVTDTLLRNYTANYVVNVRPSA